MTLPVRIDRCVCQRLSFSALRPIARARNCPVGDVIRETGCGDQCGLCQPYLRRMLANGETVFLEAIEDKA